MQRRLATHAHFAVRGTVRGRLTKQVAAATYHQVWWPPFDTMRHSTDHPPVWDDAGQSYVDPRNRRLGFVDRGDGVVSAARSE